MEKAIRRGRILREILKQEQLKPLPVEFQMAWLVAFNAGLFDTIEVDDLPGILLHLQQQVILSDLCLEDDREKWLGTVRLIISETIESETNESISQS